MFQAGSCLTLGSLYSALTHGAQSYQDPSRSPGGQSYHDPGASYHAQQTPGYDTQSNYAGSAARPYCRVPSPAHQLGRIRDSRPPASLSPASPVPDNYPAPPPANLTPGQPNTDFTDQWVSQAATAQASGHTENPVQTPSHEPGAAMDYNPGTAMAPGSTGWPSYRQDYPRHRPSWSTSGVSGMDPILVGSKECLV